MKIAVIIPTIASRAHLLAECHRSVLSQKTKIPFAHSYELDTNRIGCGQMRNKLVASLDPSYDWISFLDDDDVMLPNHLEALSSQCENADIIYSDCETVGWAKSWVTTPFDAEKLFQRNFIPVTVLMRRSLFEEAKGFAHVFAEDWDLWRRCYKMRARFAFVPRVTWQYRRIGESMLTTGQITF
jgi:hypothetical protein